MHNPSLKHLHNIKHFRIIPSTFPPIAFFENLVNADEMEMLWEIEALTNERLRENTGDIFLVPKEDRISGPGSSVIMAAFTHIGKASRFTNGNYGVYYAGLSLETAIKETIFHREKFMHATNEAACELTMRVYTGKIIKPLHNIRSKNYLSLHNPTDYTESQKFGELMRGKHSWGIFYNSVRHDHGNCIAIFRPPATTIPTQTKHLGYLWNGNKISQVYEKSLPIFEFI